MITRRVLIALAVLAQAARASPGSAEAGQENRPRWVLSTTTPQLGEVFDAWLAIPAAGNPSAARKVTILPASGVKVLQAAALPAPPESVKRVGAELAWSLQPAQPELLALHVRASRPGAFRLVARLESVAAEPATHTASLVASEVFKVSEKTWIGEVGLAWLSAAIGFLFGTLTSILGLLWERRLKKQRLREECHLAIVKTVMPELVANRTLLDQFVANPGTPVTLQSGAFNTIQGDQGPFWVLTSRERRSYFAQLESLYRDVAAFNTLMGDKPNAAAVPLATKLQKAITDQEAWKERAETGTQREKGD